MLDADERTVLITGSTDGLGRRLAERLAADGTVVLLHGRDEHKLRAVAAELGDRTRAHLADLSSLHEVHRLAAEVREGASRLDVLVNNAGVITRRRELSADGYELAFAVNHLSHFLLTALLLPLLRESGARIVNVSSAAQQEIDFDDPMLERAWDPMRSYARSKLAQVMHALELAERESEVTANVLHPATLMDTKMVRERFGRAIASVDEGAGATMRLIASPDLDDVSGRYFEGTREAAAHPQAYEPDARRRLWELSERLVG